MSSLAKVNRTLCWKIFENHEHVASKEISNHNFEVAVKSKRQQNISQNAKLLLQKNKIILVKVFSFKANEVLIMKL